MTRSRPGARGAARSVRWIASRVFRHVVPILAVTICLVGLAVRLTVRDRYFPLALLYYATPPGVLAAGLLLAGAIWLRRRLRRLGWATLAAGVVCAIGWAGGSFRWSSSRLPEPHIRVLLWNVCYGVVGWERITPVVADADADIILLVEASHVDRSALQRALPEYTMTYSGPRMLLLTRGELRLARGGKRKGCHFRQCEVSVDGIPLTVLAVDISSALNYPRKRAVNELCSLVEPLADRPLVLLGDMNTPSDSLFFEPLREHVTNAFEVAGRGYRPTWPAPLPVLDLDQIWVSDTLDVASCRALWTWRSDHRPVVAEIVVPRAEAPALRPISEPGGSNQSDRD